MAHTQTREPEQSRLQQIGLSGLHSPSHRADIDGEPGGQDAKAT